MVRHSVLTFEMEVVMAVTAEVYLKANLPEFKRTIREGWLIEQKYKGDIDLYLKSIAERVQDQTDKGYLQRDCFTDNAYRWLKDVIRF